MKEKGVDMKNNTVSLNQWSKQFTPAQKQKNKEKGKKIKKCLSEDFYAEF